MLASLSVNAAIIDINARTDVLETNPVTEFFTAGTYDVTPIGVSQGGLYNAWNPYGVGPYWAHVYFIESDEFLVRRGEYLGLFSTELEALAHAESATFTLTADRNVNFGVVDSFYDDNIGGISLSVTPSPVPLPPAFLLFSSALAVLFVGVRRRRV
jgi:hypothetical protein